MTVLRPAYVIDEEAHFSEIMATALRICGFNVTQCFDATSAWNLILANPEQSSRALMFIDMALEPGADDQLFSLSATDNFMTTGLVLANCIVREKIVDDARRSNIVLYSAHQKTQFWSKVDRFCSDHRVRKWQKRADADLKEIFELAANYVE
ncbi:hypothetical protein [Paracoccus spongiarum]|uniref:Response regulator n=1 Tax=Paracoccus spongiarum TaxID=3064387 RepID=A0ABT9JJN7_9RHOB|nr:hypothetical protein [Paracoccus sp. 2205BS29-5]MDP5309286.1 hypothetical protein [Paracoccus sp. 2205BS29-5]